MSRSVKMNPELKNFVKARDKHRCRHCGTYGSRRNKLTIHHILPRSAYPELVDDVDNCLTLCEKCHRKVHEQ